MARGALRPFGTSENSVLGGAFRRITTVLLFAVACWTSVAGADPPYGYDFDAPEVYEAAVEIAPGVHIGLYETLPPPDTDFYRFSVAEGQDIEIRCTSQPVRRDHQIGDGLVHHPCAAMLFDAAGIAHAPATSADGTATTFSVAKAAGGDWRLAIIGNDVMLFVWPVASARHLSLYQFTVTLRGGSAVGGANTVATGDGGAGSLGCMVSLLLAAGALLRRRLGALALLAAACWMSVASADPPYGRDYDAPGGDGLGAGYSLSGDETAPLT